MAQITLNIPDAQLTRVVNAVSAAHDYDTRKLANETKAQFAKRMVNEWIKEVVRHQETSAAAKTAAVAASANVDTDIILT